MIDVEIDLDDVIIRNQEDVFEYIRENYNPEDVFHEYELDRWAVDNDYVVLEEPIFNEEE